MTRADLDLKSFLYEPFSKETYRKLLKFPEFTKIDHALLDREKVIDWIILCYDYKSPLYKLYTEYRQRKSVAAQLAGYELVNRSFKPYIEDILLGNNKTVNDARNRFIWQFGRPELVALNANYDLLSMYQKDAANGEGNKETRDGIKDTLAQIVLLSSKLFGGEETIDVRKSLYDFMENEKISDQLKPEAIAKVMQKEGKLPKDFRPYGENYSELEAFKSKFVNSKEIVESNLSRAMDNGEF